MRNCPLLRMDRGDLPFRRVGTYRCASLRDVLTLKVKLDAHQELWRLTLCGDDVLAVALELWRSVPAVFLPVAEIKRRQRLFRRA